VHRSWWLATVTPDDIMSLHVVDWSDPGRPAIVGTMFGIGGAHTMRFGRSENYPTTAPDRIRDELAHQLSLAEDVLLSARRDLATRRHRSALGQACLAFEVFVRGLLEANESRVPDHDFRDRTLKELCTKKGCLPALVGKPLNNDAHGAFRSSYERVAALRDRLLHRATPRYEVDGEAFEAESDEAVAAHVDMIVALSEYVNRRVTETGGVATRFG
jgi:hypothetical protein